jgi:hypothetical protein
MISPSNPGQKGSSEVYHDGMSNADHEAQFKHADCSTESMSSNKNEENVEKEEKSEKEEENEED